MFKCAMNLNRILKAGRSLFIILSNSDFIISPTNMYFIWYSKSQIGSMYCKCSCATSIFAKSSYSVAVSSIIAMLNLGKKGPTRWQRYSNWYSVLMMPTNFSFMNLQDLGDNQSRVLRKFKY